VVESGGTRGKGHVLPKEISATRVDEKSAEAIVVKITCENRKERRAEGKEA
jgi:hypothetical protein